MDGPPDLSNYDAAGHAAAEQNVSSSVRIDRFPGRAGKPLQNKTTTSYEAYSDQLGDHTVARDTDADLYHPFKSRIDWEIARWAKLRGPSSTAFTELLGIDGVAEQLGLSYHNTRELNKIIDTKLPDRPSFRHDQLVVDGVAYDMWSRNILHCIRSLFGRPEFADVIITAPERHFADAEGTVPLYHDMHTGKWWWATQKRLEHLKPGATIIPVIISTDKTQLTQFRNKTAYPVYMTIGNLPKEIRRKPSMGGQMLIGYLPATRLEHITNLPSRRRALANLYHACLGRILAPLRSSGIDGLPMATGHGVQYHCHPILACSAVDYPEQMLTVCCKYGECPTCTVDRDKLGDDKEAALRNLVEAIKALDLAEEGGAAFAQACEDAGIKPVYNPFWKSLPFVNIFRSIAPDILHQLYQGVLKHLLAWLRAAFGAAEIDARCRRMPPGHGTRFFSKGICSLSRVSGSEHRDICRILLGLVIGLRLPGGFSPIRVICAVRGILDFLYLAQYPVHSKHTLDAMDTALAEFHANKDIFIQLGIRAHFNIPKLHFCFHYRDLIENFGTTDNTNTETTERLHIDFTKDAYRATNKKDEYPQMTTWLERKEKVLCHERYISWRIAGCPSIIQSHSIALSQTRQIKMAKHPSVKAVSFTDFEAVYGAAGFQNHLGALIAQCQHPEYTPAQAFAAAPHTRIPFFSLPAFHYIKISHPNPHGRQQIPNTLDSIHVLPAQTSRHGRKRAARFDTVLVKISDNPGPGVNGYRVARVRAVFHIPEKYRRQISGGDNQYAGHFAYVQWFTKFRSSPCLHHRLYEVSRSMKQGIPEASIIPIEQIMQSVHLFPKFGAKVPHDWTSDTVLDLAPSFFVNCFQTPLAYKSIF
ncbi:hypothetical protein PUNSTDRAFT_75804 [Punctularia strigosozonata HHB-11173 SS5]|uniref:Uncharacterized protein n=1 Tax=Punctularia strigosozonata (strain HHB-11173) TaxID=741275 RepID=R7S4P8_PUNST|nr:uncharacterized protein PUNSTDRAFT_75804 [Punctularia strigosozonata HHB-11173 SS5]EIN04772.1 hypothetical protein PUNSTDRAFT_75804 [Punctularia strigosozonata HHB-11173 SS5]